MKAAAAVLGASLIFFIGVLTGVGRQEAVPAPAAIPLGAANAPAGSDTSGQPSDAPKVTTTTAAIPSAPGTPSGTGGPTGSPGVTVTTATTATTASTTPSSTTTTRPGDVEQVDSQVNCRSRGEGKGKREPCPSTTTATEAPGGGRNNR